MLMRKPIYWYVATLLDRPSYVIGYHKGTTPDPTNLHGSLCTVRSNGSMVEAYPRYNVQRTISGTGNGLLLKSVKNLFFSSNLSQPLRLCNGSFY